MQAFPIRELTFDQVEDRRAAHGHLQGQMGWRLPRTLGHQFPVRAQPAGQDAGNHRQDLPAHLPRLDLNGYIRIDLRLRRDGTLFVLEANPNPGIASYEEATNSAEKAGINYPQFIQRIVKFGAGRQKLRLSERTLFITYSPDEKQSTAATGLRRHRQLQYQRDTTIVRAALFAAVIVAWMGIGITDGAQTVGVYAFGYQITRDRGGP